MCLWKPLQSAGIVFFVFGGISQRIELLVGHGEIGVEKTLQAKHRRPFTLGMIGLHVTNVGLAVGMKCNGRGEKVSPVTNAVIGMRTVIQQGD